MEGRKKSRREKRQESGGREEGEEANMICNTNTNSRAFLSPGVQREKVKVI